METSSKDTRSTATDAHSGGPVSSSAAVQREKSEPTYSQHSISLWMFLLFAAVLLYGGNHMGKLSGGFKTDQYLVPGYVPEKPPGMENVVETRPWIDDYMALGKKRYAVCAGCHLSAGEGNPAANIPPLAESEWVTGPTEKLGLIILAGLQGPITVKGKTYVNVMPAQGAGMKAEDLGAVMTYIRRSFGNDASIVTPEMAQKAMDIQAERLAAGKGAVTADELLKEHAKMLPGSEVDPLTGKPAGESGGDPAAGAPAAQ